MSQALLAIIVALIGASAGLVAVWQTRQQRRMVAESRVKQVDAEAYARASAIYDQSLKYLQSQLERLQGDLSRQQVRNERLEGQLSVLRDYVKQLRAAMAEAHIAPPLMPSGLGD
jgi:uncharacterized protein HemX